MPQRKQISPDERIPLNLTATERKLILNDLMYLDDECEQVIEGTPSGKPVMMTLDELDDFGGCVAAEANHCDDKKKEKKLDVIFQKVQHLLETYMDEEPPSTIKIEDAKREQLVANQAAQIAEWLAQVLALSKQLRIKTKTLDNFCLAPAQRDVLLLVPSISKSIKNKLAKGRKPLTVTEVANMGLALVEDLNEGGGTQKQLAILMVAKHLMDSLQVEITRLGKAKVGKQSKTKPKTDTNKLYQFKITLLESQPPIWRRIQVKDSSLDKFHERIQTSMGWTNSHLHRFKIDGECYGDPELLDDGFDDFECVDSTVTKISEIVPKNGKRFQFLYEYDFGDGWEHEVLFEGCLRAEKGRRYPVCVEGERSCPPEDVGGAWGYAEFLEAFLDPKHEQHHDLVDWAGEFDPEDFDAGVTTKSMRRGLPDWRQMG